MSELYMDDIDRILLEDHRKRNRSYVLKLTVNKADDNRSNQAVPFLDIKDESEPDDYCTCAG